MRPFQIQGHFLNFMTYTSHGNRSFFYYFWQILEYYRYILVYFFKSLFLARQRYYFYFLYALRSPNRRSTLSALRSTLTYGCRPIHQHPPTVARTRKPQFQNCYKASLSGILENKPFWSSCTWALSTKKILKNDYFCPKYGLPKKRANLAYLKVHTYYIPKHNVEKIMSTMDLIIHHITYIVTPNRMHYLSWRLR